MIEQMSGTKPFTVCFQFHGDLSFFLPRTDSAGEIQKNLREKTSVKDAIESCGVPHPEVDLICCGGELIDFAYRLIADAAIDVHGVINSPAKPGEGLQQRCVTKFVADGHLGKLARDLRLLGFDVLYERDASDSSLAATCSSERALLTRDQRLLMHKVVRHGYCPRSHDPAKQIVEVIRRFELIEVVVPFTRCLHCNTPLAKVDKAQVLDQLEPLTKLYYNDFRRCPGCDKIYWSGSHFEKLEARLLQIRNALGVP
jgi:uncharacterized protein with PIN domain